MIKDEDGVSLKSGDHITFTFGIPPICVLAKITTTGGEMWIDCLYPPDVKPKREKLESVMEWYQVWKASNSRVQAMAKRYTKIGGEG